MPIWGTIRDGCRTAWDYVRTHPIRTAGYASLGVLAYIAVDEAGEALGFWGGPDEIPFEYALRLEDMDIMDVKDRTTGEHKYSNLAFIVADPADDDNVWTIRSDGIPTRATADSILAEAGQHNGIILHEPPARSQRPDPLGVGRMDYPVIFDGDVVEADIKYLDWTDLETYKVTQKPVRQGTADSTGVTI